MLHQVCRCADDGYVLVQQRHAIDIRANIDRVHWFPSPAKDTRSSGMVCQSMLGLACDMKDLLPGKRRGEARPASQGKRIHSPLFLRAARLE